MSDSIKIVFTGTGSGRSSLNRFHSSFLIKSDSYNLLIDAGDGISRALLRLQIEFSEIDGILITHFHPDHFSGLISLILQMKLTKRQMPLDIFVSKSNINFLKEILNRSYLPEERLGFVINYNTINSGKKLDFRGKFNLTALENSHLQKYRETAIKGLDFKSYSLIIESATGDVFYSGDVDSPSDLSLFKFNTNSILITETTHISIESIIELLKQEEIKKIILTHIETDDPSALISTISGSFPEGLNRITIAHDGLIISV
jgi:ribonuclease Z